jgi:hypothetical protein
VVASDTFGWADEIPRLLADRGPSTARGHDRFPRWTPLTTAAPGEFA